ncbi:MAG: hypothetical protein DMD64_06220 [Gemmatimonadetes bacterium]|nr:MAG: hypothetical protein DMD64_06220 [Gemmatimonadota bacterium]
MHRVSAQTRRRLIRAGCVCLALLPGVLRAQADTTARRTTTARDTTARDTTARDTSAALLPVFGPAIASGPLPKHTRYTFTSDSLLLSGARTLSDLLIHIPGVYIARGGWYGQAEIALYGGRGPASLEVYWDGVPMAPLGRDSIYLDPARIPLGPVERVDIIVLPAVLQVYLVTAQYRSTSPRTQIGIVTGQQDIADYRAGYATRMRSGLGVTFLADWASIGSGPVSNTTRDERYLGQGRLHPPRRSGRRIVPGLELELAPRERQQRGRLAPGSSRSPAQPLRGTAQRRPGMARHRNARHRWDQSRHLGRAAQCLRCRHRSQPDVAQRGASGHGAVRRGRAAATVRGPRGLDADTSVDACWDRPTDHVCGRADRRPRFRNRRAHAATRGVRARRGRLATRGTGAAGHDRSTPADRRRRRLDWFRESSAHNRGGPRPAGPVRATRVRGGHQQSGLAEFDAAHGVRGRARVAPHRAGIPAVGLVLRSRRRWWRLRAAATWPAVAEFLLEVLARLQERHLRAARRGRDGIVEPRDPGWTPGRRAAGDDGIELRQHEPRDAARQRDDLLERLQHQHYAVELRDRAGLSQGRAAVRRPVVLH